MAERNAYKATLLAIVIINISTALAIHRYLHGHKSVEYDRHDLHRRHILYDDSSHLDFQLKVDNRLYNLRLRRHVSPLTSNFTLHHRGKESKPDLSHIYHGHVKDIPGSSVHVAIMDGHFKGTIKAPGEAALYIEPSRNDSSPGHSIMYSHEDIKWDQVENFCGTKSDYQEISRFETRDKVQSSLQNLKSVKWSRATRSSSDPDASKDLLKKHICTLRLTADHRLWDFMYRKNNQNSDRALYEILFMVESHVHELNVIFGNTIFTTKIDDRIVTFRGIQFEIRNVQIITPEDCKDKSNPLSKAGVCLDDLASDILLKQYSKMFKVDDPFYSSSTDYEYPDYEEYPDYYPPDYSESTEKERICLNFLFTARILFASNGNAILGQAYNAQVDRSGGVCFPRDNVGMVTILQNTDAHSLPPIITMNVFAHEVGHSFGAKHDDGKDCSPYFNWKEEPDDGFYLMHSIASAVRKTNNRIFSNCSVDFIARLLTDDFYTRCFEDSGAPFCGNHVVEDGEECDCGTNDTCKDKCCYAKGENPERPDLDCTLKPNARCSPSQGPCCDGSICRHIHRSANFVCANAESCVDQLYCDGQFWKSRCPPPRKEQIREDGFICNRNGRVCEHGQCNASICKLIGWRECQHYYDKEKLTRDEREELCYIGCKKDSKSDCISTHNDEGVQANLDMMQLLSNISHENGKYSIRLPMGTPCNRLTGYCDVFYRCRGVDPDTALVRLKNCVTSGRCVALLVKFLKVYWWAVTLCIIAFLIVFILFLYCCARHTKSNNPVIERRFPHRSIRDDIRTVSTIQRSIRRRVTTIRRSMKAKSLNLELEHPEALADDKKDQYAMKGIPESEPLQPGKDSLNEINIHGENKDPPVWLEQHEVEPLRETVDEKG